MLHPLLCLLHCRLLLLLCLPHFLLQFILLFFFGAWWTLSITTPCPLLSPPTCPCLWDRGVARISPTGRLSFGLRARLLIYRSLRLVMIGSETLLFPRLGASSPLRGVRVWTCHNLKNMASRLPRDFQAHICGRATLNWSCPKKC